MMAASCVIMFAMRVILMFDIAAVGRAAPVAPISGPRLFRNGFGCLGAAGSGRVEAEFGQSVFECLAQAVDVPHGGAD